MRPQAQQTDNDGAQLGDEVQLMCDEILYKVCRSVFQAAGRCAEDVRDRIPAQGAPFITVAGQVQ